MVLLTKLDGRPILINLESLKWIESVPDSLLHFLNGDTLMVKESLEHIAQMVLLFRQTLYQNDQNSTKMT